jgi:hypothetical protein
VNQGTYNRADAKKAPVSHFTKDMLPYYIYGNDEVDAKTTTFWQRVRGSYGGQIPE